MQMMLLWEKHFSVKSITIIKIRIQPIEAIGDRRARNSEDARHGPVVSEQATPGCLYRQRLGAGGQPAGQTPSKSSIFISQSPLKGFRGPHRGPGRDNRG